ncbi:MAG: GtrA family protein [Bacteroidota bacterium]|nr:GtrA family protein [Bacteroidota bacterium]
MSAIKKELIKFFFAGICAVSTDAFCYWLLYHYSTPSIAKAISFILGSIVAYIINKFWTFSQKEYSGSELIKFSILYGLTFFANVGMNKLILILLNIKIIAFLFATGTSTVLNFIGQKWWVFNPKRIGG